ncbi:MAG: sugar ABC transporter substrate-binding protein [Scrofimicrobium sp.]
MNRRRNLLSLAAAVSVMALAACSSGGGATSEQSESSGKDAGGADGGSISFRLWDEQAAEAYETVLPKFEEETGISVDVEVIPWAEYWNSLRNDIASGDAPDVFWTNSSNYSDYAQAGKLVNIDELIPEDERGAWLQAAVDQYTIDGVLYGAPALADPGIAVYYNKALLDEAGVTVQDLEGLKWDPSAETDTLREIATKLTKDSDGNTPADAGFDQAKLKQFGYNAAYDLQAIYLNYLGSNGAVYQDKDGMMAFDSPEGIEAFQYIVDLINKYYVSPSAADTNDNGDFSRDQFLQGNMALFQSGSYNLANVLEGATFEWGLVQLPEGPDGRISVVNAIVAAGSADSTNTDAQKKFLEWISGPEGSSVLGETGTALPANTDVQSTWEDFWADQGVDVSAMVEVMTNGSIEAPFGANIQAGMEAQGASMKEMFLGRVPVAEGLAAAQEAANAAMGG